MFARVLRARFGIVEGMDGEAAKAQVRAQVAAVLEDRKVGDVCYFLGQLLELEFVDSPLIQAVRGDSQQMRLLRRAVIKRFLEADALLLPQALRDTNPDSDGAATPASARPAAARRSRRAAAARSSSSSTTCTSRTRSRSISSST